MATSPAPGEQAKAVEMMFAMLDQAMKMGQITEFGFFPDGASGYAIGPGEAKDEFRSTTAYFPWVISDVHEIIPYETGKEIVREVLKAQVEAMKR